MCTPVSVARGALMVRGTYIAKQCAFLSGILNGKTRMKYTLKCASGEQTFQMSFWGQFAGLVQPVSQAVLHTGCGFILLLSCTAQGRWLWFVCFYSESPKHKHKRSLLLNNEFQCIVC